MPAFANQTFKSWFAEHRERTKRKNDPRPAVVLWPDTFNNYFFPHTAKAAVEVLESAGYRVEVPQRNLCRGRPLYDYGFLDQAKGYLLDILDALNPQITQGVPVVVLEPSCASVSTTKRLIFFQAMKMRNGCVLKRNCWVNFWSMPDISRQI